MGRSRDQDLGMNRAISRRDFLDGMALAVTGSLAYPWFEPYGRGVAEKGGGEYPPALTGMRGSHDGSWEVAHQLRDGKTWDDVAEDTGESYDLVVVGGGISGLAAAYFFRKEAGPRSRVLVIENHDDFGGHAKRNEFHHGDRLLIGYGGTQSIDTPSRYSAEAMGLLRDLGIEVEKFYRAFDQKLYGSLALGPGVFFDKETFGVDRLVAGARSPYGADAEGEPWWRDFAARAPFSDEARKDFVRLYEERRDYMPDLGPREKLARLNAISYRRFLVDYVQVDPEVIAYFQQRPHGLWGVGIDALAASRCLYYPGFLGMELPSRHHQQDPYIFHFPDGNASIARLLVRNMIPNVAPGKTMEDVVTAPFDYGRLDAQDSAVRIRLTSTAVRVRHRGDPSSAHEVDVTYVKGGKARKVRASHCVLACYNSVIPHLCPEIEDKQTKALVFGVKVPLVYTNVLIRDWTSFEKLGIESFYAPKAYFSTASLDFPVSLGDYRNPRTPAEPMVLHLVRTPCSPGLPMREQHRAGRYELLDTSFETFERNIRDQLARALSGGGFDPARDIEAITVNRWPHGYAYEGDPLTDPVWEKEEDKPWVIGRTPFGRISIANSDAAHRAYTDAAIDQAYRAVQECLRGTRREA